MTDTPTSRTVDDLATDVRAVVLELAPEGNPEATDDSRLIDDLGFHSLALLELAFALEDEFDLPPIDEATAREITTMGTVVAHVVSKLRDRGDLPAA